MRILFMGARDDEMPALEQWRADHPEHEVATTADVLVAATVEDLARFDAVTVQQVDSPEPEVYARLAEPGLRQISSRTAGVDMFDLDLAKRHGIVVTNVPVYSPNAIAEFVLASTLYLTRRFPAIERKVASHDFRYPGLIGRELATMRVGVLGTGSIGLRTARLFHALGSEVVGYDPYPRPDFGEVGRYLRSVEEVADGADVLTLHLPALPSNRHMVDADLIARLAPGAVLVNAARGSIVDTKAVLDALDSGQLIGAALDTYENEAPYYRHDWTGRKLADPILRQLLDRSDVIATPHIAFYTDTAVSNLVVGGLDNAVLAAQTGDAPTAVAPGATATAGIAPA